MALQNNLFQGMKAPAATPNAQQILMQLLEQQQANDPEPRPPTPQEMAQLQQKAQEMLGQQKGPQPAAAPPPAQPPPPSPAPGDQNFMGPVQPPEDAKASEREALMKRLKELEPPPKAAQPGLPSPFGTPTTVAGGLAAAHRMVGTPAPQMPGAPGNLAKNLEQRVYQPFIKPALEADSALTQKLFDADSKATQATQKWVNEWFEDPDKKQPTVAPAAKKELPKVEPEMGPPPSMGPQSPIERPLSDEALELGERQISEGTAKDQVMDKMAQEARAAADELAKGVENDVQADARMRAEFGNDPELEEAIKEARATYEGLQNRPGPNVGQYILHVLMVLAGANPFQAAEVAFGRGRRFQEEQAAGDKLFRLQMAKIGQRQRGREMDIQDQRAEKRFAQQMKVMDAKDKLSAQTAESREGMARLKAILQANQTEANRDSRRLDMMPQGQERKDLQKKLAEREKVIQRLKNILGEDALLNPPKEDIGGPQSYVSPQVNRLLGIGGGGNA